MYGVIGINFVDHFLNQGAPAEHKSAETPIGHESLIRKVPYDSISLSPKEISTKQVKETMVITSKPWILRNKSRNIQDHKVRTK